jgi:hypothetical protein
MHTGVLTCTNSIHECHVSVVKYVYGIVRITHIHVF